MTTLTSSLVFTVTNILAEIVFKAVNGQNQVFLDNIVVAYMVADMEVDKVADMMADMVADIEVDMVADIDINMEIQFDERVGSLCEGSETLLEWKSEKSDEPSDGRTACAFKNRLSGRVGIQKSNSNWKIDRWHRKKLNSQQSNLPQKKAKIQRASAE